MINHYKKVNFTYDVHNQIYNVMTDMTNFVLSKDPHCEDDDYWSVSDLRSAEVVSKKINGQDIDRPLETTLYEVFDNVSGLKSFFDMFELHYFVGKTVIPNFPIHRHSYGTNSRWGMCIFGKNSSGSVDFYSIPNENPKSYLEPSDSYFYDQLVPSDEKNLTSSIIVNSYDIYCFDVWNWHTFSAATKKVEVYLVYFKQGNSLLDVENVLSKFENFKN